ncbi:hypothetical protein HMPREF3204_00061 [Gardnerella pickettii]|nr:hypothetical protein HMPREF3204_00061 [Gardnerella pickettii]
MRVWQVVVLLAHSLWYFVETSLTPSSLLLSNLLLLRILFYLYFVSSFILLYLNNTL